MNLQVINGNSIEVLKQYPDNYFDSVVTDPPYGLGKEPNAEQMLQAWITEGYMEVKGTGFMGKEWDAFVPQPLFWKEVFRVLKPGGHILAFYGTRTYDWGVMAMRLAGFEIRDQLSWVYGSGFPKSHNISKGIDKMYGAEREVVGSGKAGKGFNKVKGFGATTTKSDEFTSEWNITASESEEAKQWDGWGSALKPAQEPIVLARKPLEKGLSIAENVLKWGTGGINIDGCRIGHNEEQKFTNREQRKASWNLENCGFDSTKNNTASANPQGRFPANIILTHHPECECKGIKKIGNGKEGGYNYEGNVYEVEGFVPNNSPNANSNYGKEDVEDWKCHPDCPIKIMDEQSGLLKSGKMTAEHKRTTDGSPHGIYGKFDVNHPLSETYGDSGGASRFFYTAKASKSERNFGLEKESWFHNLELVFESCSFTEKNLFIWEKQDQNQNMDLNGEAQQKKDMSEGIALLVEDKECYTTLYGKGSEVLFPKAIKFTTSTGLSQTIELKTLNFYQPLNTNDCIADVIETNKGNGLSLAENVGIKNLLKQIFTKDEMGFLLGVKIVAKKTPQSTSVKDAWQKTNIHSTVKPVKLIQYLVRLITPPNGRVLDPFNGSGTTGIACSLEGFDYIGIELDPEYCKISEARIKAWDELEEYEDYKAITKADDINDDDEKSNHTDSTEANQLSIFDMLSPTENPS